MARPLLERAKLTASECEQLLLLADAQQFSANLFGADIFIDCMDRATGRMYVAAQASPEFGLSAYRETAVGKEAARENEPAVYHAIETGLPVRDLKAVTQEYKTVRQDAVPIKSCETGAVIAVLISERDVSRHVNKAKKYEALARMADAGAPQAELLSGDLALREIHHRVKNNLQMVASIMNLQSRRTDNAEVKLAFRENTARVLSIAAIHDLLTRGDEAPVPLAELFDKLRRNIQPLFGENRLVEIVIEGDALLALPNRATDIALVVNELVSNSLEHGFAEGQPGKITILLSAGVRFNTITVKDNGSGFDISHRSSGSLGLSIVTMTVRDKLGGKLRFSSDESGTTAAFDFLNEG